MLGGVQSALGPTWALLIVALISCLAVPGLGDNGLTTLQGTALLTLKELDGEHVSSLFLRTGENSVVRCELPDHELPLRLGLYSGQLVAVRGALNASAAAPGEPPSIRVESIEPIGARREARATVNVITDPSFRMNSQKQPVGLPVSQLEPVRRSIRMLVIPIRAQDSAGRDCPGVDPIKYSKQDIWDTVLSSNNQYTLKGMYADCSAGRTVLDSQSKVTDFAILPCSGSTQYGGFSMTGCGDSDQYGWQVLADDYVVKNFGIRLEDYDQISYIGPTPSNILCPWLAVGDYGCMANPDPYICRMWAHGSGYNALNMYFHEIGHHFSLGHASQVIDGSLMEYHDSSCAMGFCCALRCYNAPHSWQMGWLAVTELNGNRLTAGSTFSLDLSPQPWGKGVRITPDWASGATPFFLSFRGTQGYDKDLANSMYGGKTNIYVSPITSTNSGGSTQWLAAVAEGQTSWSDGTTGLTVRHLGPGDSGGARISICRYGGPEDLPSCCYGRDNDCNGQGGEEDPGCAPFMDSCPNFKYQWDLGSDQPNPIVPSRTTVAP